VVAQAADRATTARRVTQGVKLRETRARNAKDENHIRARLHEMGDVLIEAI